jgi:dipeptidyl aminopeptidase/acylaminoacyl peptidase
MILRFATVLLATAVFAVAQPKPRLLTKETFFDMETISNPNIAPDGSVIVFSRGYVDIMKDQNASNLWVINSNGERLRELTQGPWRDSNPVWSPDGKRIAFLSNRSGSSQIHVMWADTKESAQLTHVEYAPSQIRWSPDSKSIAFNMTIPDDTPILPVRLPKTPKGAQLAKGATIIDRLNWRSDGIGPIDKGYSHVFVVDAVVGGKPRQITQGNYSHSGAEWSPDGKTIYVSGIRKPEAEYLKGDSEIYAINLETLEIKALTDRKGPDGNPKASPDGRWIAYTGYDQRDYTNHIASIYLMHVSGDNKRTLATNLPSSPQDVEWAPDGSGLYYSMQEVGQQNTYFVPLTGGPKKVTEGVHLISGVSIANNGRAAAVRTSFREPGTLVTFDIKNPGTTMRKLLDVNADVLEGMKLADVEELWFTAPDGLKVQGWLMKPVNFDPNKKYPMVLWIHGGPWSMYTVGWNWAWQNWAANGYAVLYTNPRGSTGYGQDFVNGIQYSYPGKDYDDLMAGVDAALAKGFIDKDNLFVCGGSGGGVLTAWIVGHTDRFRAAVSMRPVINWHSFVGTTDGASWYYQFRKFPWEDPMEYAVRSPLHYVGNVKTPTMVMTGEADLRTPMSQSEEYYRALKMLKRDTLLVRMPDEFHGWRRPSHQLLQQLYLMAWFEKYRTKDSKESVPLPSGAFD